MSKNNPNTEEILDAIKNMMSESSAKQDQELPKDVVELTNPINEETNLKNEKMDILELTNLLSDEDNIVKEEQKYTQKLNTENLINDDQIKKAVETAIKSIPSSRLDEIINEQLTKIIQERLKSSKIIISSVDKKN